MQRNRSANGGGVSVCLESLESRRLLAGHIDPVIEWDNVLIDTLRADTTRAGPGFSSRAGAIVHAAIFNAVNAIDGKYVSYHSSLTADHSTSADAAVAAAGWRTLSSLYPAQQADLDDALATTLARVKNGPKEDAGVALGIAAADEILALRANDHSEDIVPYTPGSDPGDWRPTEPGNLPALGPGWGLVTPFMMDNSSQFEPPPVPALTSDEYTTAYNEVKSLGEKDSTTRTADQTEIGIFWGYDRPGTGTPPALYNQIVQVIANQKHNTTVENARLFALANLAMADSGIAAWQCKYVENFWRPITGIREGNSDGNDDTAGDPTWEPLGAPGGANPNFTPPFPAYVSGHATFGAAVFEVLKDFYHTDHVKFTLHSDELPGVTRTFNSFSQAADENGRSRIYLGIHWQFDNTEGQALGRKVADFAFANALTRVHGPHGDNGHGGGGPPVNFVPVNDRGPGLSVITLVEKKPDDLI
jgi:hypothetical protein